MDNTKYSELFRAFEKAPMCAFMDTLFSSLKREQRKMLMLEDVSYHRYNADLVTLEAWMCVAPVKNNQWIWVRVELNGATGMIEEQFFTKDNYRQQALGSLDECIDYYKKGG